MKLTLRHLKSYSALQQRLLFSLFGSIDEPLGEGNFRSSLPLTGSIISNSEEWVYRRHGDGVHFSNGKAEVDAIKYIFAAPSGFEAWRIKLYFESLGEKLSEESITMFLKKYVEEGCLYKYPFKDLYVLNISCFGVNEGSKGLD